MRSRQPAMSELGDRVERRRGPAAHWVSTTSSTRTRARPDQGPVRRPVAHLARAWEESAEARAVRTSEELAAAARSDLADALRERAGVAAPRTWRLRNRVLSARGELDTRRDAETRLPDVRCRPSEAERGRAGRQRRRGATGAARTWGVRASSAGPSIGESRMRVSAKPKPSSSPTAAVRGTRNTTGTGPPWTTSTVPR